MEYNSSEIINNLKENSVGVEKKTKFNVVRKIVIPVVSVASSVILFSSLCGCMNFTKQDNNLNDSSEIVTTVENDKNNKNEYDSRLVSKYLLVYSESVRIKFAKSGVNMQNIFQNKVKDYKKVKDLNKKDIFSFYIFSSYNFSETEKVIKALGYDNLNDYLIKEGYVDEKGNPSLDVWVNNCYQEMYDEIVEIEETENIKKL